jgi:Domain of unknown function (DUF4337)
MPDVEVPNPEELTAASDRFSKRVALMTAVYAVVLAIASLGGNNAMKEMLLAQQEASNQWAFYQAKVIREHQYRSQKLVLEADLEERAETMKPESRRKLEAALRRFAEEEKRYAEEKKDIEKAARHKEAERDRNQAKDPYFDYAQVLLQIAIVMGAVSILSKSRPPFYTSLVLAIAGAAMTFNGYTLLFRLPLLHAGH